MPSSSPSLRLLCINAGSSSLKISIYQATPASASTSSPPSSPYPLKHIKSKNLKLKKGLKDESVTSDTIINDKDIDFPHIDIIVHRIVQGGYYLRDPVLIDDDVMKQLKHAIPLDPLHNPPSIKWIYEIYDAMKKIHGGNHSMIQVATFDTTFFKHMNHLATLYPLPNKLVNEHHIIRYGYHGLAHLSMLNTYYNELRKGNNNQSSTDRIIACQLGSGCSVTAIRDRDVIDHSMGFTSLEGLLMSTRSGSIDPSIVIYLQRNTDLSVDQIEHMLYYESGLLAVSNNESNDTKALEESSSKDAKLAIDLFIYQVVKCIGSYITVLGGIDSLIFGGGIGENSHHIRKRVLNGLSMYGFITHDAVNEDSKAGSRCITSRRQDGKNMNPQAYVVKVDESIIMAEYALQVYNTNAKRSRDNNTDEAAKRSKL